MIADTLLVICPVWGTCLPPMGAAYIAAYLESKGVPCEVLDLNVTLFHAVSSEHKGLWRMENFQLWMKDDAFEPIRQILSKEIEFWSQYIVDKGFKTVGFSLNGANTLFTVEMAKLLRRKSPDICIVFGGPSCNFLHGDERMPFRFLMSIISGEPLIDKETVDYVVLGEGEEAFFEIVSANRTGAVVNRPGVIPGAERNRALIQRPVFIKDLDALPFPAWGKLPLEKYDEQDELPVLFGRGCINRCAFCNDWSMWGGKFRCRSAKNIFEEIKYNREHFGRKIFRCNDLLFNGNLRMLEELAELIIGSGIETFWTGQGVVRTDMKPELFKKLREAGLVTIIYGLESLADNVLKKMGKPFTYDGIHTVLKRAKDAGINVWINLIIGFPGETEEDFKITQKHLEEIRDYVKVVSSLNLCNITASTEIERYPERFGVVFPEGQDKCECWETADGTNTFAIRKRRAQEMYAFMKQLRIQANFVGMYDGESPLQKPPAAVHTNISVAKRPMFFSWHRILGVPVFALLLLYHLPLAFYLRQIKLLRNTIMFPGG